MGRAQQITMKLTVLVAIVVAVAYCANAIPYNHENNEWTTWKNLHEKSYAIHEENHRRMIWDENKRFVLRHNYEYDLGKHTYKVGLNKFADLTNEEFRAMYLGSVQSADPYEPYCTAENNTKILFGLPDTVDWRKEGYVTGIKDQAQCGSCWAFSATGSLEGQNYKKTGKLVSFSEQNLVDCSGEQGNDGCGGGFSDAAYRYINVNGGIDTEESYPYLAVDGKCHYDAANSAATVSGCIQTKTKSEAHLKTATATIGPLSVAIDAGHQSFQLYEEGIYYEPECSEDFLDHGVLIVGYGSDNGQDYWLVKNSWGETWGNMGGYLKMSRNRDNNCGISTRAIYPTL